MTAFRLSLATVAATFALLLVGGLVNPTGSSLACPDWPLCYGSAFPEMVGGVLYEHSHRLVATFVGALTCLLAVVVWRSRGADAVTRWLAVGAVVLVVVQGVLGGVTVLLRLPTLVSTAHLAVALAFFLLLIHLSFRLWPGRLAGAPPSGLRAVRSSRALAVVLLAAVYAQSLLGAFVRHTGAGRACGDDFPTCEGSLWPEAWVQRVNMAHRFAGVGVALLVLVGGLVVARRARGSGRHLAAAAALLAPTLALSQVALGVLTVVTSIGLAEVMAHFAVGVLLLADLFVLVAALGPHVERVVLRPAEGPLPVAAGAAGSAT